MRVILQTWVYLSFFLFLLISLSPNLVIADCYDPNPIDLTIGISKTGSICNPFYQKYRFPVISGKYYQIKVSPFFSVNPDLFVGSSINISNTGYYFASSTNGSGFNDSVTFMANSTTSTSGYSYAAVYGASVGDSNFSIVVYELPPNPPNLGSPGSGVSISPGQDITFTWGTSSGANRYRLKICTDPSMSDTTWIAPPFQPLPGVTSKTVEASYFSAGQTYYWQVGAIGEDESYDWGVYGPSPPRSFSISKPLPPDLSLPGAGATLSPGQDITFTWGTSSGANRYRLKICTDPSMSDTTWIAPPFQPLPGVTSKTVEASYFSVGQTYYWQVGAIGEDESYDWGVYGPSPPRSFTVNTVTRPLPPALILPTNASAHQSGRHITFQWGTSSGANRYRLKICTDPSMSDTTWIAPPFQPLPGVTSKTVDALHFFPGQTYYWQVGAIGTDEKDGWGDYGPSVPWSFSIQAIADTPFLVPLFRGYSSTDTDHFYTTNPEERDVAMPANGYVYEKDEGYISNRDFEGGEELFRFYNSTIKSHFYTTSMNERNDKLADPLWRDEGPAGYVFPGPGENLIPMYHLYKADDEDHFYTISEFERDNAVSSSYGYQIMGVAFYVARNSSAAPLAGKPVIRMGGVDLSSGNFVPYRNHVDFANPSGFGLPFVFARTYNSMNATDAGPLGPGWSHSYQIMINAVGNIAVVKWGNGREDKYTTSDGVDYSPPPGVYNKLRKISGSYILTTKANTRYTFVESVVESVEGEISIGRVVEIKDRNDIDLDLYYDPAKDGVLSYVEDGSDRIYRFHYEEIAATISTTNRYRLKRISEENAGPLSRSIQFDYDLNGRLITCTDPENNTTTYEYADQNTSGLLTKIILPEGNTITAEYNLDQVKKIQFGTIGDTQPDKTVKLKYNVGIAPDGIVPGTTYSVISAANTEVIGFSVTHNGSQADTMMDGLNNITKVLKYDANLNPTQIKDKNGRVWFYDYDPVTGNIKSVVNPENEVVNYEYDPDDRNNLIKITDQADNITRFEYDDKGNVEKIIKLVDGIDRTTTIARYPNGQIEKITTPSNNTAGTSPETIYTYDSYGYLASITDALGHTSVFTHDPGGRLLYTEDPDHVHVDYSYDLLNRVESVTDMLSRVTSYTYDKNGNLETVTDPRNIITTHTYNDLDLVETITRAGVRVGKFGYDDAGRRTRVINAKDRTWEIGFDAAGNINTNRTPLGLTDRFLEYYPDNRLKKMEDRTGRQINYAYDGAGRLTSKTIASGYQHTYKYWPDGTLKEILQDSASMGSLQYDDRKNLKQYTDPYGKTVNYEYFPGGMRKAIIYPGGNRVDYDYDRRNLLTSVKFWGNREINYLYTDGGRLKKILYPNGASMEYTYDAYFRLQTVTNTKGDGSIIVQYTVDQFDPLDAPLEMTTTGGITAAAQTLDVVYDYDNNNRIVSAGSAGFTHNNHGEMLSKTGDGNAISYTWDEKDIAGRLKSITIDSITNNFTHDGLGNKIGSVSDGVTTRYVLDVSGRMANVLMETDAGGNAKVFYIHGLGLAARILPDGTAQYYHYDLRGNTAALTDDAGNVTDQYAYDADPYAFDIARQGTTDNPFTFVGRYGVMDEGNNIYYMRARFYDAENGRFISEDPIGFEGGDLNLYAYVGGNPISGIDPSGLAENEEKGWFENALTIAIEWTTDNLVDVVVEKIATGEVTKTDLIVDLSGKIIEKQNDSLGKAISGNFEVFSRLFSPVSFISYGIEEEIWPEKHSQLVKETAAANADLLNRYIERQRKGRERSERIHDYFCKNKLFHGASQVLVLRNFLGGTCE